MQDTCFLNVTAINQMINMINDGLDFYSDWGTDFVRHNWTTPSSSIAAVDTATCLGGTSSGTYNPWRDMQDKLNELFEYAIAPEQFVDGTEMPMPYDAAGSDNLQPSTFTNHMHRWVNVSYQSNTSSSQDEDWSWFIDKANTYMTSAGLSTGNHFQSVSDGYANIPFTRLIEGASNQIGLMQDGDCIDNVTLNQIWACCRVMQDGLGYPVEDMYGQLSTDKLTKGFNGLKPGGGNYAEFKRGDTVANASSCSGARTSAISEYNSASWLGSGNPYAVSHTRMTFDSGFGEYEWETARTRNKLKFSSPSLPNADASINLKWGMASDHRVPIEGSVWANIDARAEGRYELFDVDSVNAPTFSYVTGFVNDNSTSPIETMPHNCSDESYYREEWNALGVVWKTFSTP